MLKAMNKRSTVDKYIKAIKMCRDAGIKSCAYILFGFPGENEESVEETIDFLDRARPDKSRLSEFVPFPGCDVGNNPRKYNVELRGKDDWWYYDNKGLSLKYKYIKDRKMLELRSRIRKYFREMFKQEWVSA